MRYQAIYCLALCQSIRYLKKMEKLITIKAYLGPVEASMMHSILESEEVYSFLKDQNSVIMAPYLANAIGGIKLQVRESEVEKAVDILKEAGYLNEEPQTVEQGAGSRIIPVLILFALLALLVLYQFLKMR
jgi:hypothetical protein